MFNGDRNADSIDDIEALASEALTRLTTAGYTGTITFQPNLKTEQFSQSTGKVLAAELYTLTITGNSENNVWSGGTQEGDVYSSTQLIVAAGARLGIIAAEDSTPVLCNTALTNKGTVNQGGNFLVILHAVTVDAVETR